MLLPRKSWRNPLIFETPARRKVSQHQPNPVSFFAAGGSTGIFLLDTVHLEWHLFGRYNEFGKDPDKLRNGQGQEMKHGFVLLIMILWAPSPVVSSDFICADHLSKKDAFPEK